MPSRPRLSWRAFARACMHANLPSLVRFGSSLGIDWADFASYQSQALFLGNVDVVAMKEISSGYEQCTLLISSFLFSECLSPQPSTGPPCAPRP